MGELDISNLIATFFWLVVFPISIFVVIIVIPQKRRQKKQKEFQDSLKVKEKVVTYSGMIGVIEKIEENTVLLRVDEKTRIKFLKDSIMKLAKDLE